MTRLDRALLIVPIVSSVGLLLIIGYLLLAPRPVEFHQAIAVPEQSEVCPGDTLRWTIGFSVRRAPVVIAIVRSWWSVDRQQTLIPDDSPSWTAYLSRVEVDAAPRSAVVPGLPPGDYHLQTGVQALRSAQPDVYVVPFAIPGGCDES